MFESHQKFKGTQYTTTVALLLAAFLFGPAILIVSGPAGYLSIALMLAWSAVCAGLAWLSWTKHSRLTIPSIETSAK